MSQAGLGKPACQYSGAEFRQRAKGLAKRLGEPVERLAALCEALATTNASRSQKPKLPARLLRDASADGGLEAALKALDTNQRKNVNEDALQTVEKAWLQAGLTQEKRICFDTTVDARNRRELTTIAKAMSCSIVDDETSATHIVFFNPAVDAIVDESEYLRTLVVDDARHLALVHWWYRPDSADEWIPLERVEGAPPPLKDVDAWARPSLTQGGQPWRVCCRYLRDAKAHNEFGDERDYVEEEEVCFGVLTPSTRVVSGRGGRWWSLFRF
jgi:SWI/SNF related-matrix-associated actin-dependent regulator of chromatin subfamily C